MNAPLTIQGLIDTIGPRLKLRWVNDEGRDNPVRGNFPGEANQAVVGPLNCIHPNRIQVIGHPELVYMTNMGKNTYRDTVDNLFAGQPAAIIFSDGIEVTLDFVELAKKTGTTLLASPVEDNQLITSLHYYLTLALAERITVHGVFMEVLGMGVLLTGDAAVGKSELALALLSRGHQLIADDAPEFYPVSPETLNGTCPPLLRDFLEVRGLGILNIREMFGDSAVRQKKDLNLIITLKQMNEDELARMDRLQGSHSSRILLGVKVTEITLPVAPGRNLAILVEVAARHHALRLKGYNAGEDFIERQRQIIEGEL